MTIGEKIKNARMENGLAQEELASKMMVSRQAITKWKAVEQRIFATPEQEINLP